jgi:hypothetical protein
VFDVPDDSKARKKAYNKAWREANKDKIDAQRKAYREANKEKVNALQRSSYERNKESRRAKDRERYEKEKPKRLAGVKAWRDRNPGKVREYQLLIKFGISLAEFDAKLAAQKGACAICGLLFDSRQKATSAHVDHCHETKKVRDLLCGNCNTGLGMFNDNASVIAKAFGYLLRHSKKEDPL